MAVEHAPVKRRSFFGSFPQIGTPIGMVMATGVLWILTTVLGKPAMAEALHSALDAFEVVACEPISMVIELENAAVMAFTRGVSRATGRSVQGMLAHFMRFRDGKIVELREFMDSLHAAEQALGRELIERL